MRWRQFFALTRKEVMIQTSRNGVWALQMGFLVALAVGVFVQVERIQSFRTSIKEIPSEFRTVVFMGSIGALIYYGSLLLGPLLAAGALDDERERGTTELFASAPVRHSDLALAMVAARMLVFLQFFGAATPILLLPLVAVGWEYLDFILRTIGSSFLAATVTTIFALTLAARGKSARWTWISLVLYVICAPFGMGIRVFALAAFGATALGIMSSIFWSPEIGAAAFALYFPFVSLFGSAVLGGGASIEPLVYSLGGLGLHFVYILFSFRRALPGWLSRQVPGGGHREVLGRVSPAGNSRSQLARSLLSGDAKAPEPPDPEPEGLPPVSFREPEARLARALLRVSRHNPFLLKEIRQPSIQPLSFIAMGAILLGAMLYGIEPSVQVVAPDHIAMWTGLVLIFLTVVIAIDGSRLLPPARRAKPLELLLPTPLAGGVLVRGSLAILALHTVPVFLILLVWHLLWGVIDHEIRWAFTLVFHAATWLLLVGGISLWAGLIGRGSSQRVGGTLLVAMMLGSGIVPGFSFLTAYFWVFDPPEPGAIGAGGLNALVLAVALYAAVPIGFERWTKRARILGHRSRSTEG